MELERLYYNAEEMAKLFPIAAPTFKKWARTGLIPAKKINKIWLFNLNMVENFLEKKQCDVKIKNSTVQMAMQQ